MRTNAYTVINLSVMRSHPSLFALALLGGLGCSASQSSGVGGTTGLRGPGVTLVYVVRHAEKAADPGDGNPDLTEAGKARAKALARTLQDVPLAAIYSTPLARNVQTAAPVAAAQKLEPEILAPAATRALADRLIAAHRGDRVLVVGHSNTIPELLRALGYRAPVRIDHGDYDDLFLVWLSDSAVQVDRLHYGAPGREDPPPSDQPSAGTPGTWPASLSP